VTPDVHKILVLRGGALGDFIVTLPAIAALRERWPAAEIHLAGHATAAQLAVQRGLIDRVHSQHEAKWAALYAEAPLPHEFAHWLDGFDLVVNFWPDPEGTLVRHFKTVLRSHQTLVSASAMPSRAPAAAHYLAALEPRGIMAEQLWHPLAPNIRPDHAPIAIHPGSGSRTKNWPADRWRALIAELPRRVVLITGPAESAEWKIESPNVRLLANAPLEALVAELSACRLFLGHDSGVSHLAAACGVPSILLFGPTDPAMWAPPAPHVTVLRRGNDLNAITVADVLAAVRGSGPRAGTT
jgi:ADP-heptose:LPS heptosyltransferase